jgi:hypothetical protein
MNCPLAKLFAWMRGSPVNGKPWRPPRLLLERLEERTVPTVMSTQLFFDQFDNNDSNVFSANWSVVQGATHDVFTRLNPPPPSNGYAIKLDVDASGGNLLTSRALDLSAETNVTLSYYYERKGGGVATAAGDDLIVEGKTASGSWVQIDRELGSGPAMTQFQQQTVTLSSAFDYNGFQFRFRRVGVGGDWFIDTTKLAASSGYGNYWSDQSVVPATGFSYPNTYTVTFPNTPAPSGGGSLTITPDADVGGFNHYLTIMSNGQSLGNVFGPDGRSFSFVTTTIPLSKATLQSMIAGGSIQISVIPASGVFASSNWSTPVTLHLEYATGTARTAPVVDLNGPNVNGIDFASTFTAGFGPASIVDSNNLSVTESPGTPDPASQGVFMIGGGFALEEVNAANPQGTQLTAGAPESIQPRSIAIDANGDVLVAEGSSPSNTTVSVVRINPFSGSQEVFLSGNGAYGVAANHATGDVYTQGPGFTSGSFAIDQNGDFIYGYSNEVDRVNHVTLAGTVLAQNGLLGGANVWSVAVEPGGTILATAGTNLVRINPVTGAQSLASNSSFTYYLQDVTVGDNGAIYVIDANHSLIKVDPVTGQQTALSLNFYPQLRDGLAALLPGASGMTPDVISATVTITNRQDGAAEVLAANTTGTRITASYDAVNGILHLTGGDSPANYQQVLRSVTYNNTSSALNNTPRVIQFVINDGTYQSAVATSTVNIFSGRIVDNGGPGYSETGTWSTAPLGYGGSLRYSPPGGNSGSTATWQVTNLAAGYYTVQSTWNADPQHGSNVPYQFFDGNTLVQTVPVNQQSAPLGGSTLSGVAFQYVTTVHVTSGTLKVTVSDTSPTGNAIADAIDVVPAATPTIDLNWSGGGITGPTTSDTSSTLTINRTYTISGSAAPGNFTIGYYASTDTQFAHAMLLGTETISASADMTAGTHAGTSPALQLSAAGTYYLFSSLDVGNAIIETDKTNNVTQAPQSVTVTGRIDTIVDNGGTNYSEGSGSAWSTANLGYGGTLRYSPPGGNSGSTATWQVTNLAPGYYAVQSTWNADPQHGSNVPYQFFDGNTLVQTVPVNQRLTPSGGPTLSGVAFQYVTMVHVTSGTLKVTVSDNANGNAIADAIHVLTAATPTIDLNWIVSGAPLRGPTTTDTSSTFTINRTYAISGSAAPSNFTIGYYASTDTQFAHAVLLGTETISASADKAVGVHPGTSPALQFTQAGTYYLFAYLDNGNAIIETDKTNNVAQAPQSVTVTGAIDVIVANSSAGYSEGSGSTWSTAPLGYGGSLRYSPPGGNSGSSATWQVANLAAGYYTVQSTWNADSQHGTRVPYQFFDGNTLVQTVPVNQQPAPAGGPVLGGVAFQYVTTVHVTSGTLKVTISDNAANGNAIANAIHVVTAPTPSIDLNWAGGGITGPTTSDTSSTFTINRTYNISGSAAPSNFTIGYYASTDTQFAHAVLLGTETISASADRTVGTHAGTSPALQFSVAGTYYLFAYLDNGNAITETDKTNNVAQAPQTVTVTGLIAQIVDNGGAGYSESSGSQWTTAPLGYGGSLRYSPVGSHGGNSATWQFTGLAPGSYVIEATWNSDAQHATNAPYQFFDNTTLINSIQVNQRIASSGGPTLGGVTFQVLATVTVNSGTLNVTLSDNGTDGNVIADAIRVVTAPGP